MQTPREQRVPWRVVVADDQQSSRLALCAALRRAGVVVVAEAFDGTEAVELARYHQPDLVIIDVGVPGLDAIAATRRITSQRPPPIVILLTGAQTEALGLLGLRAGAAGCLPKNLDVRSLARAIVGALRGEAAIPRTMAMRLIEQMRDTTAHGDQLRPVRSPLTARQWEVLDLICDGSTNNEIAAILVVSPDTVRSHLKAIFRRLNVHSRDEAAAAARQLYRLTP